MKTRQKFKITSLLICALAVLFYVFFMHAKHDPVLSKVNAFADDPYDAVGSFGIQAAIFLGILSLVRAFRTQRPGTASAERERSVLLAQTAAILSVGVTLAADAVAMLRHSSLWIGSSAGYRLAVFVAGMAVPTIAIGFWTHHNALAGEWKTSSSAWTRAGLVSILIALALLLYPGNFRRGLIGVLFTALIGTVFLFAPVWAWTTALVPDTARPHEQVSTSREFNRTRYHWAIVILAGVLIGLFFVAGEASEGSGIPRSRLALVISAYIGLETAGLMIGYGFLGKPLGLFRRDSR